MYSSRNTGCVKWTAGGCGAFVKHTPVIYNANVAGNRGGGERKGIFTLAVSFRAGMVGFISRYENAPALALTRPDFQAARPRVDKGLMNLDSLSSQIFYYHFFFFLLLLFIFLSSSFACTLIRQEMKGSNFAHVFLPEILIPTISLALNYIYIYIYIFFFPSLF